jgi:hypothetical protein
MTTYSSTCMIIVIQKQQAPYQGYKKRQEQRQRYRRSRCRQGCLCNDAGSSLCLRWDRPLEVRYRRSGWMRRGCEAAQGNLVFPRRGVGIDRSLFSQIADQAPRKTRQRLEGSGIGGSPGDVCLHPKSKRDGTVPASVSPESVDTSFQETKDGRLFGC